MSDCPRFGVGMNGPGGMIFALRLVKGVLFYYYIGAKIYELKLSSSKQWGQVIYSLN